MGQDAINHYLNHFIQENDPIIESIRLQARADGVPIIQPISMAVVLHYIKMKKPKKLLEIGTAVGYSAIKMAMANHQLDIVTIERDDAMYQLAKKHIKKMGLGERITIIHADALDCAEQMSHYAPFDMLFIDAAKAQYTRFFKLYEPYVRNEGMIITDNILFRGLVAQETETIENKRIRRLVKKIKDYNQWLMNHPSFNTIILPIEDGIAVSLKHHS